MSKDWDYAKLAHAAKMGGGPEKYLDAIKTHNKNLGRLEGKAEGKAEVLIAEGIITGIALLGVAGYKAFTTIKDKHERERLQKEEASIKVAERKIIDEINENNAD